MTIESESVVKNLNEVFGAQKAEWLGPLLFDLFEEPSYFTKLTTPRPCFLVGGRGTGKTTVLRGLSYEGQYAIHKQDNSTIKDWEYYGIYYRVDTNRVSAFQGDELTETEWIRRFAHYINLLMCTQIVRFLAWFQNHTNYNTELDLASRQRVANTLNISLPISNENLLEMLQTELTIFENYINNVASTKGPSLSMQGAPIQSLLESIENSAIFKGKHFFFLIDEYENLRDYQQKLMNTLIKHSGELFSFKVGVREFGWRVHTTLNEAEQLISPADYTRIDINNIPDFELLAYKVCQDRLNHVMKENKKDIKDLLPGLSEEKEAQLLGITKITSEVVDKLTSLDKFDLLSKMSPLEIYMLEYWSKNRKTPLSDIFEDYVKNQSYWKQRLGNYQHALLYTLVKNRTGIRKYYCGWDTFVKISGGNIRFLLQLVEESLMSHLRQAHSLDEPVSPDSQTISAQKVGRMNLTELEGLAVNGATLTKLLLGLGRVFGVMAATSEGHAPEVNQFKVASEGNAKERKDVDSLLTSSVMHLALVRWSGSKLSDVSETVEWDYMVHPIFAPFFNFSYRRKRKLSITGRQLLALVSDPHQAIKKILDSSNRVVGNDLPEQLQLFEMYYADKT